MVFFSIIVEVQISLLHDIFFFIHDLKWGKITVRTEIDFKIIYAALRQVLAKQKNWTTAQLSVSYHVDLGSDVLYLSYL